MFCEQKEKTINFKKDEKNPAAAARMYATNENIIFFYDKHKQIIIEGA